MWAEPDFNSIVVKWLKVEDALKYEVEFDGAAVVAAAAGQEGAVFAARLSADQEMSRFFGGLQPNTEHTFRVRAGNAYGFGEYSSLKTAATKTSRQSGMPSTRRRVTYPDGRLSYTGLDPVNAITGSFLWSCTLLEDYGKDALQLTLMYDSGRDGHETFMGKGWTHALNYLLYQDAQYYYFSTPYDQVTAFLKEEGSSILLPQEGSGADLLNLSQLQYRIDSVQTYLKTKKAGDAKRLLASNYQKSKSSSPQQDSIWAEQSKDMYNNPDSLYLSYDEEEKQRAVSAALQYAREVKQRNQDNMHYYTAQQEQVIRNQIEWHRKFSLSFACFIFFFIGAPLGAIIRKGGLGMPVVVSVFLFIIYYIIDMMGIRSAREAVIAPQLGTWISSLVLLPLGVILTYKSVTDSEMMNTDAYKVFFEKVKKFFSRKQWNAEKEVEFFNKGGEKVITVFDKVVNTVRHIFKRK